MTWNMHHRNWTPKQQLDEGKIKNVAKSAVKTAWETLPLRGDVERKLKDTKLGRRAKKSLSGTRSAYDAVQGLPAGGSEKEIDKMIANLGRGGDEKKKKKNLRAHVEHDAVLEYFKNYFGDSLNEDTTHEDIIQAVEDLILLTEAVCKAVMGVEEDYSAKSDAAGKDAKWMMSIKPSKKKLGPGRPVGKQSKDN